MAQPITWDHGGQPLKLKKPHRNVHFTPTPSELEVDPQITPFPVQFDTAYLPTPDPSPDPDEKKVKKKGSFISKLIQWDQPHSRSNAKGGQAQLPPSPAASDHSADGDSWKHHTSYFPEYEPIFPSPDAIPGVPGVVGHTTYFPDYTPIHYPGYPSSTGAASGTYAYAMGPVQAQAQAHAARVGHNVVVHYPDLPRFADYAGDKDKGGKWASGKWGVEGWNGFGWEGEKLPNLEGQTFGAPMPKGTPIVEEKKGGKGKGKKGGEGDGEGGEEGEGEGEKEEGGGDAAEADEGAGAAAEGGGEGAGGGGGKSKNKKKKK